MSEAWGLPAGHTEGAIRDELSALIDRHQRPLFNFLAVLLGDRDAAQDCAQDAFLGAYEHLRHGREVNAAWLYRVARNRAIDELRHRKRVRSDPGKLERIVDQDTVDSGGPALDALAQLSPGDRELLYLFDIDGFDGSEIAAMLGISRGAVHVRVFRARERFRIHYRRAGDTP